MARNPISVEYVMGQQKYLNILQVIQEYSDPNYNQRVTIDHLRFKFLKNYKQFDINEDEMLSFFSETPFYKIKKKEYSDYLKRGTITKKTYKTAIKTIELQQQKNVHTTDKKTTGDANLKKYLRNLKNLGLIEQIPVKKGKPYYVLTRQGMDKILRVMVHKTIDLIPDGTLAMLEVFSYLSKLILSQKLKDIRKA